MFLRVVAQDSIAVARVSTRSTGELGISIRTTKTTRITSTCTMITIQHHQSAHEAQPTALTVVSLCGPMRIHRVLSQAHSRLVHRAHRHSGLRSPIQQCSALFSIAMVTNEDTPGRTGISRTYTSTLKSQTRVSFSRAIKVGSGLFFLGP